MENKVYTPKVTVIGTANGSDITLTAGAIFTFSGSSDKGYFFTDSRGVEIHIRREDAKKMRRA